MVGIAQLVEHLVVVQDVAGSSPVTHPSKARARPAKAGRALGHSRERGNTAGTLLPPDARTFRAWRASRNASATSEGFACQVKRRAHRPRPPPEKVGDLEGAKTVKKLEDGHGPQPRPTGRVRGGRFVEPGAPDPASCRTPTGPRATPTGSPVLPSGPTGTTTATSASCVAAVESGPPLRTSRCRTKTSLPRADDHAAEEATFLGHDEYAREGVTSDGDPQHGRSFRRHQRNHPPRLRRPPRRAVPRHRLRLRSGTLVRERRSAAALRIRPEFKSSGQGDLAGISLRGCARGFRSRGNIRGLRDWNPSPPLLGPARCRFRVRRYAPSWSRLR